MSEQETKTVNKARAILAQALTPRCGCAHCEATARALDTLRELGGIVVPPAKDVSMSLADMRSQPLTQEGGA